MCAEGAACVRRVPWNTESACARAQMTSTEEELLSLDFYARKTFFKTASLMANSCKAVALLGGQSAAVAQLAHDYGRHLGLAFQARAAPGPTPKTQCNTLVAVWAVSRRRTHSRRTTSGGT